ncbi:MAG: hypothetical protein Kow0099_01360 [Candidatus Abyssubacteria bacterium]
MVRLNYGEVDTSFGEYFDWEYRRNPEGRATIGCAVAPDGTVCSVLAAVPVPVLFDGRRATAAVLVNGLTHPDYRRLRLFPGVGALVCEDLKRRGVAFSYGLPNPNSYPDLTGKMGYGDIGRACLLIRPHRLSALLSARYSSGFFERLRGLDGFFVRAVAGNARARLSVEEKSSFEGLPLGRLRGDFRINPAMEEGWLTWRYLDIPRRRYRIIATGRDGATNAVAVYRISIWDRLKIGTVNDLFLSADADEDMVEALMSRVFAECEREGCAATFCLVSPGSLKLGMLKRAGFVVVPPRFEPQPFAVIWQGHTAPISDIGVSDFDVSFGMYDIF